MNKTLLYIASSLLLLASCQEENGAPQSSQTVEIGLTRGVGQSSINNNETFHFEAIRNNTRNSGGDYAYRANEDKLVACAINDEGKILNPNENLSYSLRLDRGDYQLSIVSPAKKMNRTTNTYTFSRAEQFYSLDHLETLSVGNYKPTYQFDDAELKNFFHARVRFNIEVKETLSASEHIDYAYLRNVEGTGTYNPITNEVSYQTNDEPIYINMNTAYYQVFATEYGKELSTIILGITTKNDQNVVHQLRFPILSKGEKSIHFSPAKEYEINIKISSKQIDLEINVADWNVSPVSGNEAAGGEFINYGSNQWNIISWENGIVDQSDNIASGNKESGLSLTIAQWEEGTHSSDIDQIIY